jgi:flagellar hook-associated protein 1 FlgK
MASLLGILYGGANTLNTAQGLASTASRNISNVNTPGYSRQTANLVDVGGALPLDPGGVVISSVTQARDQFVEAQVPSALGNASFSKAQSDALSSISALDPTAAQGLSTAISSFYSAVRALAQNAGDAGLRQGVVSAGAALGRAFNLASQEIASAQSGIDSQVAATVAQVDDLSAQVASLNAKIRAAKASNNEVNTLIDARQAAQDELAKLTGARPATDAQGDVLLSLPGGKPLVWGDSAGKLEVSLNPRAGQHLQLQVERLDGTGAEVIDASAIGGSIGGLLAARDGALTSTANALDQLASDLADAVNQVHAAGYALDGSSGRDFFTAGVTSGAAGRLAVSADIAADPSLLAASGAPLSGPGDSTNLTDLLGTQTKLLSTGSDVATTFSSIVSRFGSAASMAAAQSQHDQAVSDHITTLRESISGVSVDEELVKMQQAQRAYESMARVMTTVSAMLDTLMQIK